MGGPELVEKLKQKGNAFAGIFMSGYTEAAALIGMMSRSHSGSGSVKLAVGGRMPLRRASAVAAASRAPAAPRPWPCIDLVELTAS